MSDRPSSYQFGKSKLTLRVRLILATVIILIYGGACCLHALVFSRYYPGNDSPAATDTWSGAMVLGLGWMSLLFGCVAWVANILLLLALLFFLIGWRWATVISSGLTVLLSLDTFRLFLIEFPGDEGGVARSSVQTLQPGAWLWLASIGAIFVVASVLLLAPREALPPLPSQQVIPQ
jgi:hypothetical protein